MKKRIKKNKKIKIGKSRGGEEEKGNTLLFVLILLVIIISVFSTLIVLNSIDNAKKFFISQQTSTSSGKVDVTILPNPENPPVTGSIVTGKVILNILPRE